MSVFASLSIGNYYAKYIYPQTGNGLVYEYQSLLLNKYALHCHSVCSMLIEIEHKKI
jgi:hypothetical protein